MIFSQHPTQLQQWLAAAGAPRACVAHQHDGGGGSLPLTAPPALPNVGALCFFAHCGELQLPQLGFDVRVLGTGWEYTLQPVWLSRLLLLGGICTISCKRNGCGREMYGVEGEAQFAPHSSKESIRLTAVSHSARAAQSVTKGVLCQGTAPSS